ncbi:hypothetical protein ACIBL5_06130 [Streptomyces sp. NPDC050516]|uniref:hypothetical protein n=1 Tax=Streptomyces sp. NPDC050516 TaxID=3365621 RepID=UPI0037B139C8
MNFRRGTYAKFHIALPVGEQQGAPVAEVARVYPYFDSTAVNSTTEYGPGATKWRFVV